MIQPFAYAHYSRGSGVFEAPANIDRMATHLEYFLKLAPNAPEQARGDGAHAKRCEDGNLKWFLKLRNDKLEVKVRRKAGHDTYDGNETED